jgi:hypothetical protein
LCFCIIDDVVIVRLLSIAIVDIRIHSYSNIPPLNIRSWFITALLTVDLIIDFGGGVGVALLRLDFFFFCNAAPLLIGWALRCSFKDFLLSLLLVFLEACG